MNFSTILVPIDFSDVTPVVVQHATELAKAFGGRLILLHVSEPEPDFVGFDPGPQSVRVSVAKDFRTEHHRLDEFKHTLAASGLEAVALHIQGPLAEKILSEARQQSAGLIVMGSHGHGALYHLLVGSVASSVLKHAPCPVLIVPAPQRPVVSPAPESA